MLQDPPKAYRGKLFDPMNSRVDAQGLFLKMSYKLTDSGHLLQLFKIKIPLFKIKKRIDVSFYIIQLIIIPKIQDHSIEHFQILTHILVQQMYATLHTYNSFLQKKATILSQQFASFTKANARLQAKATCLTSCASLPWQLCVMLTGSISLVQTSKHLQGCIYFLLCFGLHVTVSALMMPYIHFDVHANYNDYFLLFPAIISAHDVYHFNNAKVASWLHQFCTIYLVAMLNLRMNFARIYDC